MIATVRAPLRPASDSACTVSMVVPLCEIPIATSPSSSRAALVSITCASDHANDVSPIRCSFCWRSAPTNALAPTPYTSIRRAFDIVSMTERRTSTSMAAPVSSTARASV